MRALRLALGCALAGAVCAVTVHAEDGLRQPATVKRTSFNEYNYGSYYAEDETPKSPSDEPAPAAAPDAAAGTCNSCGTSSCNSCCDSCNSCCDSCLCEDILTLGGILDPCCTLGEQCTLMDHLPCVKQCSKLKMGGWLNQSYTWNPQNPADRFNGPVTWTDRSNEYQLNQLYYWLERPADNGGEGWAWGGRADLLFGTDWRFNSESNLETQFQFQHPKSMGNQRFYGLDYLQFYGELAYNKLKVKFGHFLSPVGYEVVPTTGNFFPTLPYIFQYGEPFTHTGILGTYQIDDNTTWGNGVIRGWDNFGDNNPNLGYIGTFTRNFEDKSSYASVFIWSMEPNQQNTYNFGGTNNAHSPRFVWTHAYTKPLTEKLSYVLQFDYAQQTNAMADGRLARWYGWNQYLFYKVSDCWSWGTRFDIWRDEEGFRIGGFLGTTTNGLSTRGLNVNRYGYAGTNFEWSVGANWRPNANTVIRPAVRWDWFSGTDSATGGKMYDGNAAGIGTKDWQFLVGFDWITLF